MKLSEAGLKNREQWLNAGYALPEFDREKAIKKTKDAPVWVHFGIGNIFRAFQCNVAQKLLNQGIMDRGITAVEGYDCEIVDKVCDAFDNYNILVTLKADGNVEKTVIGSVMEALALDTDNTIHFNRLKKIFSVPSLQLASFTITEKGYSISNPAGELFPAVAADMENGPEKPVSYIGKVTALLYERYLAGALPVAMVSMDNCSHNGDKLFVAVSAFADAWVNGGKADAGFAGYIKDKTKVSFPWTMIDKITPRPDNAVLNILQKDGVEDQTPFITEKSTYIAPFVNAEECEYLVVEDCFPNGRPELEKGGVIFTDRETVDKVEKMKVCTCLNPLHTSLAVFGCLLGYELISEEMKNPALKKMVEIIGYKEGLPVVVNPGIINPEKFIDEVVNLRIPNPFMPDTPQRIATDTSQKLAIRFGETIKAYMKSDNLDVADLKVIPIVFAGWLRYLMAVDDSGNSFELSPDPLLEEATAYVKGIKLGDSVSAEKFEGLYRNPRIFGVELFEAGLAELVTGYFNEMIASTGAVSKTLEKHI
ncbi:MAG: mannitol dehydrogenase family protein [Clostridia bacterium]|nr:mannitol dehydrogenase family protein [Clostridia bacterium]